MFEIFTHILATIHRSSSNLLGGFFYSSDGSRFMSEKFQIYVKRLNILHNGFDHHKQITLYFAFYSLYYFQSYIHLNLF